jgi:hypothetical protein
LVCRVALIGLGDMGRRVAAAVLNRKGLRIVGAVDCDPSKVGRELGEYTNLGERLNVKIESDVRKMLKRARPNVTIISTASFVKDIVSLVDVAVRAGSNVITPSEEMVYPRAQHSADAARIDRLAKRYKVAIVGAGANPGFFPDSLVIALTGICTRVDRIRSTRINDMGWGSMSVLKSLGVGFTPEEFEKGVRNGTIPGHVGFHESIRMIADRIGWKIDKIQIDKKPIVSKTRRVADIGLEVNPGMCAGCAETAEGLSGDKSVIELELIQQIRPEAEGVEIGDFVWIEGEPSVNEAIKPGIRGGVSTAAMLVNAIPRCLEARPGLHSVMDLSFPSYFTKL